MNGLLISMIFLVVVMMGVTFVLVTTIVGKITENSRNVKRREDYIVGKKKEEKKVAKVEKQKNNKKQSVNNNGSAFAKINKILAEELEKVIFRKNRRFYYNMDSSNICSGIIVYTYFKIS